MERHAAPRHFPGTLGTDASCSGVYRYSDVVLTMAAGDNTLWAEACDADGNCTSESTVFTYLATDTVPPSAQISPSSLTTSAGTVSATITWCDGNAFGAGRRILLNGTVVTGSFSFVTETGVPGTSCTVKATSTGSLALRPGVNILTADIQDVAGNWGPQPAASVAYTYRPTIDTSPTNQFSVVPQMFDATLSYGTPSYRSLDQDRSVTLVYNSSQAWPTAVVHVDLTDNSSDPAPKASIQLQRNGAFLGLSYGSSKVYYNTGAGTSRLVAWMEVPTWATGSYAVTAVITRYWPDGRTEELTAPVRVLVVNERQSQYGAGWTIAGVERVVPTEGGILVTHGDGSATFYPAYTSCSPAGLCDYGHSPGDFGRMQYDNVNLRYVRTGRDGTRSYFDAAGNLSSCSKVLSTFRLRA